MGAVKLTNLSRLFRHFADMIDNGYCDNITEDDIDAMTEVLKPYLNVKVNYEQAKKITGKTEVRLTVKYQDVDSSQRKKGFISTLTCLKSNTRKFEWLVGFILVIIKYAHPHQGWVSFLFPDM